jgi:phage shock protein PspC (stress-responsive transcriptional regulator)
MPLYKELRRSRTDRMIAGVCAGAARYLGIDPVVARVLFAAITVISGGTALIAYAVAWFVMPEETWAGAAPYPTDDNQPQQPVA